MSATFTTTNPYYLSLDKIAIPKAEYENSICKVGGYITDYFSVYFAKQTFSNSIYDDYIHHLSTWIDINYSSRSSNVTETYEGLLLTNIPLSYIRNGETIHCSKCTIETPYNIVKIHIENVETSPDIIYIFTSISAKLPENQIAHSETEQLEKMLTSIRKKIVEDNMYHNDKYYEELREECAIEYARDHL
jgi:hypothetical protein